jgi:hypothetical protein
MHPAPLTASAKPCSRLTARALRVFALRVAFAPAILPVLIPALYTPRAHAQEFRGTISGAVTDPTGAAVPGAAVQIKEVNTGTTSNTKSDSAGQYVVPFLLPGTYTITITMPGFQTVTRAGIVLQSQEHPIINLTLPVGETSTTVTVSSEAPLVDQANASVGQVISAESVADLPLNGRTPTTLTELSEGVITTAAPQIVHPFDNAAGNSWSIGGTPNQVSEVLLDGSPDLTLLGALAYAPTQDSVQEVSVRPFDTDASFGHTIGGVINQITKSGTNAFHGTAYEFYQTAGLDANSYFSKRQGLARPNVHYHQYGGTFGGPIVIPKLYNGKDKLFFFVAYEGLKDSTPNNVFLTVPTASERAGDFSETLAAGCPGGFANNPATAAAICLPSGSNTKNYADPNQLYNPFTATMSGTNVVRSAILNNQLTTAGALNPIAKNYFNLIPLPNNTSGVAADGLGNYSTNAPSIDTYSNEFGRLDFNLSSRDHIFYDFRHNHRTQVKNNYFGNNTTGTTLLRENYGSTIDNVYTINPTTILDTRFNWTYFNEVHGTPAQQYSGASVGLGSLSAGSQQTQLPCVLFGGTSINPALGSTSCGTSSTTFQPVGDNTSALDPTTSYQAFADVVKTIGRHTVKVGFDGRQYRLSVENFGNSDGTLDFGSSFVTSGTAQTAGPSFGGDLASFYFGLPSSGALDNNARSDYHSFYIGSFVQDDWRVNDKLTVNLGIRFDIDTPFREKAGKTVNGFNPTAVNSASVAAAAKYAAAPNATVNLTGLNTLGGLTFPGSSNGAVYNTNSGFVSPRVGFSYSPNSKDVIRGGFGIFVQPETLGTLNSQGVNSSNALSNSEGFSASDTFTATTNNYLTPANTLSNPFPNGFATPVGSSQGPSTFLGQSISFLAPNEHDPYSERYDLGFQHELTSSTLLEMLYVGNHSLHLPIATQNLNALKLPYLTTAPFRNQTQATAYAATVANPFAGLLPNGGTANSGTVGLTNLLVPYPQFGTNSVNIQNQTIGQSYFNSAIAHVEQRTKHGLTLTANFSFSKLLEADTFLNDEDTTPTRRVSPFDHTYHFTVGGTYNLPFGRGKLVNFGGSRLADEILGGFVVNGIYQFQTGAPIVFTADIPLQPGASIRSISNQTRNASPVPATGVTGTPALSVSQFVTGNNTACSKDASGNTIPCDLSGQSFFNGQYANHYRTLPQTISNVRGDGFNNLDASLLKDIHFTEKTYLQLRFETFNTLNHAVFAAPNVSSATASNFGYITATYANSQARQIQLGGRFVF